MKQAHVAAKYKISGYYGQLGQEVLALLWTVRGLLRRANASQEDVQEFLADVKARIFSGRTDFYEMLSYCQYWVDLWPDKKAQALALGKATGHENRHYRRPAS